MFASIFAAENGAKTIAVERNKIVCRKLLHTGGGRCNLTHTGSVKDFIRLYGQFGRFLQHSLYEFSADDLQQYFTQHGLRTKVEKQGCVFPITDRASDVSRVLFDYARKLPINFLFGKRTQSIEKDQNGFVVLIDGEKILSRTVIIATGGITWPFTGSDGDGYNFAKALGHTIIEPRASLTSLITAQNWPRQLSGIGVQNVIIKAKVANRKISTSGALMFTHDGIGGPAVLDLSRLITDFLPDEDNPIEITIDIMPEYEIERLDKEIIRLCTEHPKKDIAGTLAEFLPRALMLSICKQLDPSKTILAGTLSKNQRKQLVHMLKKLPISITSTGPLAEATVTRGGISIEEIDSKTMESKLCPGLFFAGEVINVDGPCGGFNLQIAFSTGQLAGSTAAKRLV